MTMTSACRRSPQGEPAAKKSVTPEQHFTQPPPRYTEATLVKRMEELGIGRPSTYASIVTTIQDREYVRKDKNRLIPEDKGRLVTAFLTNYFRHYVGYDFTADLEDELDDIIGRRARLTRTCWPGSGAISRPRSPKPPICASARFWTRSTRCWSRTSSRRARTAAIPGICPNCGEGRLSMKTARSGGAFIGCSNYPECRYTRALRPPRTAKMAGIGRRQGSGHRCRATRSA